MGSKDSGHVGDFIIGQFSSCFFFVHDLQPGENVIQVEIKFVAPWKWYQPSFTTFVKLTNPFYDASYPWKRDNTVNKIDLVLLHCDKAVHLSTCSVGCIRYAFVLLFFAKILRSIVNTFVCVCGGGGGGGGGEHSYPYIRGRAPPPPPPYPKSP